MGIPTLWSHLTPSTSSATLVELAWTEGFNNPDGSRHLKLGVDASIWLFQVQKANSDYPLHALFYRLATLFRLPIRPLFVFDGKDRPDVKRGKFVPKGGSMASERAFRDMIDAFGFDSWTAPGEAEAELAYLSSEGRLDAVQTEDVDALVFGAAVVYMSSKSKKGYLLEFEVYNLIDLEEVYEITHPSLILAALLSGGDYDPKGSKSFGPKKALALAKAGFAQKLYDAFTSLSRSDFVHKFSPQFRAEVAQELRTNSTGFLGQKFKVDADMIASSSTFPEVDVVDRYINPVTSALPGRRTWPGFRGKDARGTLDGLGVAELGRIMERELRWEGKDAVLKRGSTRLWEGGVRRAMQQEIERPGTWTRECSRLGLVALPTSASTNHRIEDFYDPSISTSLRRSPGSSGDEKTAKSDAQLFGETYPFLLTIKKKRVHANTGDSLEEYQCVFDTSRLNAETVRGLTNGGILEPADVKPRSLSAAGPSSSQPGSFTSKAGDPPRRFLSDDDDDNGDMRYAMAQSLIVEASHHDVDFRPRGGRADATIVDEQDDDDQDSSPSPSVKAKPKKPTPPFDPTAPVILWIPALILQLTHPDKIAEFEEAVASKEQKKADLLAVKAERARVKEAKKKQTELSSDLMESWVSKVGKPRTRDKGKGKEVVRAKSSSTESTRAGSAAPSCTSSSKRSVPPPDAEVIEISDDNSENEDQPPIPRSRCSKRVASFRRVPSGHLDPTVASSSQQPLPPIKSKSRSLHAFPSASSFAVVFEQPPSKLQKRSPLKRTPSALSAFIPDALSENEEEDGFPLDAFTADKAAFGLATPEKKRRTIPREASAAAPYSPAKRFEPMRSLSPSPASKTETGKARKTTNAEAGLSKNKGVIHDLSDSDDARPNPSPAFSSPPPRPKPRSPPSKRSLGSLPPQTRPKALASRSDVFSFSSSPAAVPAPPATRAKTLKKPVYVEMDSD